ncbi:unnamed protein product [Discula destructiva]
MVGVFRRTKVAQETETFRRAGSNDHVPNNDPDNKESPAADVKTDHEQPISDSDSSRVSLEARDEKEIQAHPDQVTATAEPGVQKAEAAALVWPKWAVYGTYAWIWVCFFMLALQQGMTNTFNVRAYADFAAAPELTTAAVAASVVGGIIKLPIAKLLNLWGRAEAFLFFVGVYELGMIILASCTNTNGYAAGYVLYWIGYDALYLILDVFVADTSGLRNRAFAFAFVGTPFICTAFTAPLAAASFLSTSTWRWGYGAFCIIMAAVFVPLAMVFKFYTIKARKMGLLVRQDSGRSTVQSFVHYFHEFDIVGCVLLMAAFLLVLLPFSLTSYGLAEYKGAQFIAMLVVGILLFPTFYIWERYFTRTHFIRWELFQNRTVTGACALSAILYFSFYQWDLYLQPFILVVYNLDIAMAGYVMEIYNVGSAVWGVLFGLWVRQTKHFKYTALFFGLPLMFLGSGLMIYFRSADQGIGYIVMCQIFIAFAGGTLVISEDMAVMSAADRDGVPMMLSVLGLCSSVGGAFGYAVTGAIYNNVWVKAATRHLPEEYKGNATTIWMGSYTLQTTYEVGSPVRDAINEAWGDYEKNVAICGTAVLILAIPAIAVWKNYNVDRKQNKGIVI